ncbi:hypothetical protein AGMMS4956_13260 [Bacteroidia bacterium]|nr:hypothetical protein AGMMS4956_13260 [Bacteroidia bacterium]
MIELRNIELSDKKWIEELFAYSNFRGCEYSFGNNYVWQQVYEAKIARYKDFYISHSRYGYCFPAGRGDIYEVTELLREHAAAQGEAFVYSTMDKASMEKIVQLYGDRAQITTDRDVYDYVYEYNKLASLAGKKLQPKRNHLHRFQTNDYRYEPITTDNIAECLQMLQTWHNENDAANIETKNQEVSAVTCGLTHFFELGFIGGLLRVNGQVQAFSYGERLNSDTFVVHAEKALKRHDGVYTAMNYELVNHVCSGYAYINREEDMGVENLRKSKMSYHPAFLVEKFSAIL